MEEFENTSVEGGLQLEIWPNYSKYIKGVWRRKWLVLLVVVVVIIPFFLYSKSQVPIYSASTLIGSKDFQPGTEKVIIREIEAELRTRAFMENVVAKLGLTLSVGMEEDRITRADVFETFYTTKTPVRGNYKISLSEDGKYRLYKIEKLRSVCIDSTSIWDVVDTERTINDFTFRLNPDYISSLPKDITFSVANFFSAVNRYFNQINAAPSKSGLTMSISMKGKNPELLTRSVNRLAEFYVTEILSMRDRDTRLRRKVLDQSLAAADKNLREAEADIQNFRQRFPVSLDAEKSALLTRLQALDKELAEIPQQIETLENLFEKLESAKNDSSDNRTVKFVIHQLCNFPGLINQPSMAILKETLSDQENAYKADLEIYSESAPISKEHLKDIKSTYKLIEDLTRKHLTYLYARKLKVADLRNRSQSELSRFPAEESRLMELERRRKINESHYLSLFAEVQKSQIAEAVKMDYLGILDPAVRPKPTNGNKTQSILLGGLLGLFLGFSLSVLLEFLDKSIRTIDDVKSYLGLNVLGAIPNINFKDVLDYQDHEKVKHIDHLLVTHDYSPSPIGECYRALRTNLMYSKSIGQIRMLVLTSTEPGEGKSFTSVNLSIILAQQRTNTLLVDADLRRGVIHNTFGCPKEPGLTNYLTNSAPLSEIVNDTQIPNLSVIGCGSMIPNPSELLGSLQMRRFLEECRRKFDIVVFDTPPLSAATDAVVLGTQVDAVALVIRSKVTNKDIAKERLEIFKTIPANLIGIILNGSESDLVPDSYSYYHY